MPGGQSQVIAEASSINAATAAVAAAAAAAAANAGRKRTRDTNDDLLMVFLLSLLHSPIPMLISLCRF